MAQYSTRVDFISFQTTDTVVCSQSVGVARLSHFYIHPMGFSKPTRWNPITYSLVQPKIQAMNEFLLANSIDGARSFSPSKIKTDDIRLHISPLLSLSLCPPVIREIGRRRCATGARQRRRFIQECRHV